MERVVQNLLLNQL